MAIAVNSGVVDTEARLSSEKVVDMDPKIGLKETDNAQFMTILSKLPSTDASQVEVRWLEDRLFPNRSTLAASATSAATTIDVATDTGAYFRAKDIVYVEQTGEKFSVTSISTDQLTVVRSIGGVVAATAASGGGLVIVGNAAAQGADTGTLKSTDRVLGYNFV